MGGQNAAAAREINGLLLGLVQDWGKSKHTVLSLPERVEAEKESVRRVLEGQIAVLRTDKEHLALDKTAADKRIADLEGEMLLFAECRKQLKDVGVVVVRMEGELDEAYARHSEVEQHAEGLAEQVSAQETAAARMAADVNDMQLSLTRGADV
eukprot:CAMPEP_0173361884 /NCGR_PEP_ID=MMETSP1144-20121109/21470_1 /TAXON_ID=483371 /ORGANISM="non described non described, Strain CCMP2298" /LENGTH=152 /DNA_ID=CAMNT_0014311557 /DNA_START=6 /DNA_END=461 /DNA_ORIENTATION=-